MRSLDINMQPTINYQPSTNNTPAESQKPEAESKIVGLTGGIGSGKSKVAQFIMEMGFPVYDSDGWAKELVNEDEGLKQKIMALLGPEAYDQNGRYNRKWIAEQVFENEELLQKLNRIIHPAVKIHFEEWAKAQKAILIFKETALLFELNLHKTCYKSILITAEENIRIRRVMERDGRTYREVKEIIDRQMPEAEKIKLADFVIENNGDLETLKNITQNTVEELLDTL